MGEFIEHKLLNIITGYKKSVAIAAAMSLKLPQNLEEPVKLSRLAKLLQADQAMLALLLIYLEDIGIVKQENMKWTLTEEYPAALFYENRFIIEHEINIMQKWNRVSVLTDSIQKGNIQQERINSNFSDKDRCIYFKAMNGENLKLIVLWSLRECHNLNALRYLEWGRSGGAMSTYLRQKYPDSRITLQLYKECDAGISRRYFEMLDKAGAYDFIHIYNTIHYMKSEELKRHLYQLKKVMSNNTVLCIVDIFLDNGNKEFLIDWMTHGGIYNLYQEELHRLVDSCGLQVYKTRYLNSIYTSLLFIRKRCRDTKREEVES